LLEQDGRRHEGPETADAKISGCRGHERDCGGHDARRQVVGVLLDSLSRRRLFAALTKPCTVLQDLACAHRFTIALPDTNKSLLPRNHASSMLASGSGNGV